MCTDPDCAFSLVYYLVLFQALMLEVQKMMAAVDVDKDGTISKRMLLCSFSVTHLSLFLSFLSI